LAQEQVLNTPYVSKIWMALIANAFNLGDKEWGLHLLKKFPFMAELALLRTAVKSSDKKNLIYRLYQRQISYCSLAKS
jgi:hypothetical protein